MEKELCEKEVFCDFVIVICLFLKKIKLLNVPHKFFWKNDALKRTCVAASAKTIKTLFRITNFFICHHMPSNNNKINQHFSLLLYRYIWIVQAEFLAEMSYTTTATKLCKQSARIFIFPPHISLPYIFFAIKKLNFYFLKNIRLMVDWISQTLSIR